MNTTEGIRTGIIGCDGKGWMEWGGRWIARITISRVFTTSTVDARNIETEEVFI